MSNRYRASPPDFQFWKDMVNCQAACPVHTDSGRYVQLIAGGAYREAYLTARSPNPFASVCGRVCAAPCEDHCRRAAVDEAVSIRALKRFVCERYGAESIAPDTQRVLLKGVEAPGNRISWHLPSQRPKTENGRKNRRVAVAGAGPAGMACAHDLAVMGYGVTVFEASATQGGMLFHGIPEFRLPRTVIDKEIAGVLDLVMSFLGLASLAIALSFVFIGLGLLLGAVSGNRAKVFGASLALWFFFVLFYDLLVLGVSMLLNQRTADTFLGVAMFGNPIDVVRLSALFSISGETVLGAGGAALIKFLGTRAMVFACLITALSLWAALPVWIAGRTLERRDI